MFTWFKQKEKETETAKPSVNKDLDYVIRNSKQGEEVKGIDKSKLALISVKRQDDKIAVSVEFERNLGRDIFTEIHRTLVNNADEAVFFFTRFGITEELSWLGGYRRKVSLTKW